MLTTGGASGHISVSASDLGDLLILTICASDRVMMDSGNGSNGHRGLSRAASAERLRLSRAQRHRCLTVFDRHAVCKVLTALAH
ncbi:MAG: hypothetical protein ACRDPF_26125 [Streptosporangiaceae bacterium]